MAVRDKPSLIQEHHLKIVNKYADVVGDHIVGERKDAANIREWNE